MIIQQLPAPATASGPSPDRVMTEDQRTFLDCPACEDQDGAVRCGLPAEVKSRFVMHSSGGLVESVMIRCPSGHWFNGPVGFLQADGAQEHAPGNAAPAASAGRDSLTAGDDSRDRTGGPSRPNSAPAYYLGRPASRWMTATRPRHRAHPAVAGTAW